MKNYGWKDQVPWYWVPLGLGTVTLAWIIAVNALFR
jgi:hypothetical protein